MSRKNLNGTTWKSPDLKSDKNEASHFNKGNTSQSGQVPTVQLDIFGCWGFTVINEYQKRWQWQTLVGSDFGNHNACSLT